MGEGTQCSYEEGASRVRSQRSSSCGPRPEQSWGLGTRDWGCRQVCGQESKVKAWAGSEDGDKEGSQGGAGTWVRG